jgi:DNA-binding transcriptional MerR regulator
MKKVHEVCKSIGVTRRTLHYYDEIGLLSPTVRTESGYRLYDDMAVEKLFKILLLSELGYSLNDIQEMMNNPDVDLRESIGNQIEILNKKKARLENLIGYANTIKLTGIIPLNFEEYGDITFEEFIEKSKNTYNMNMFTNNTEGVNNPLDSKLIQKAEELLALPEKEWYEYETSEILEILEMAKNILSVIDINEIRTNDELMDEFMNFVDKDVSSKEVQEHVKKLYDYMNKDKDHPMSLGSFSLIGKTFAAGGDVDMLFTSSLGKETTDYIAKAIQVYCDNFTVEHRQEEG